MRINHNNAILIFVILSQNAYAAFVPADLTNAAKGFIQTSSCLTECYDYFSTSSAKYCNKAGVPYCCSTTISNANCFNNIAQASTCSDLYATPELKYHLCPNRNDIKCGEEQLITPTIKFETVKGNEIWQINNEVCFYQLQVDLTSAAIFEYIELFVNYYLGSTMTIVTGTDVYTATNKTTPTFNTTYKFSTRVSGKIQQVWISIKPDTSGLYPTQFSFSYRFYTPNYDQETSLKKMIGFIYTETEKYQVPRTTFLIAVCCGGAGIFLFAVAFTYVCTKFQYWVSPPNEHIRKMQEYKQKDIEFQKSLQQQKNQQYAKSEWNRDTPYKSSGNKLNKGGNNDTYDDEMQATNDFRQKANNKKSLGNKKQANGPRR
eukprot:403373385